MSKLTRFLPASTLPARRPSGTRLRVEALEDRTVPTAVAVPDGLVSWWTANNTAADATGLNNGTLLSGTTYAAGEVQQGFSLNGNVGVAVPDSDSLKFTASMSIEGWIKLSSYSTTSHGFVLFRGDSRGGLDPYTLSIETNGQLTFGVDSGHGGASVGAPIPLGQFVHVAATLDDATGAMKLYENGAVVAQTVTPFRPFRDLDPTQNPGIGIGTGNSTYHTSFYGIIDELAVYNRALTAGEVQGIYTAGGDGKVFSQLSVDTPSVVEGATGTTTPVTFTISRTGSLSGSLTATWATADATATSGSDYVAASGTVTFAPGEATKTVAVTVNGDNTIEPDETFRLVVTPVGGTAVMGVATIVNDDVGVSVSNATATEGDARIGSPMGAFVSRANNGGLSGEQAMAWGPDGNLYVGSLSTNQVLKYDGATGAYLGVFLDSSKGLAPDAPFLQGLQFRPDGKLYVMSRNSSEVQRFDAVTGEFVDTFIPSGSGGLNGAKGMTVGPDGNWYVCSGNTNQILRYDGTTGAFLGVFVAAGSGGVSNPRGLVFGPDGNLYVASAGTNALLRYNGQTGAFIDAFVPAGSGGLNYTGEPLFHNGSLYITSGVSNEVIRYDAQTGAYIDKFTTAVPLGQHGPIAILFDSNNNLLVGKDDEILRFGPQSLASFTVSLSIPSATPVTVDYTTASGTATAGSDFTPVSGTITFAPGQTTQTVVVSTLDDALLEGDESFSLILSNVVGAAIVNATGVGTILDNEVPPTKFYVVNDGSSDQTFEYAANGVPLESYTINSGNTAPRGAASTSAGDTVWVVDANKKVYIYDTSGVLLGSWSAGGLNSKADIQGITTNGTDIWLVDAKMDVVYKYTGAATRLSGSQNATSSFSLNSSNTSPKDLVTDGTSIWVVNDASTDKVFKYTLTGSLVGSWKMTGGGGSPTGITLDPTGASQDLWVVDNATAKVYQYAAARGLTSGSAAAASTFALATGNTNPQGIADPPPAGSAEVPSLPAPSASIALIPSVLASTHTGVSGPASGVVTQGIESSIPATAVSGVVTVTAPARGETATTFAATGLFASSPVAVIGNDRELRTMPNGAVIEVAVNRDTLTASTGVRTATTALQVGSDTSTGGNLFELDTPLLGMLGWGFPL